MGALTNRKRCDEHLSLNHTPNLHHPDLHLFRRSPYFHSSKKFRFPSAPLGAEQSGTVASKDYRSRFSQYPGLKPELPRVVHAPCRVLKFGPSRELKPNSRLRTTVISQRQQQQEDEDMGNWLTSPYNKAKSQALGSSPYVKKEKKIFDVDSEPKNAVASGDSSIEEVGVIEDGREGRSDVYEPNQLNDAKVVEPGLYPSTSLAISELTDGILKLDNTGKLLDALSLDSGPESVAVYKDLLRTAEGRSRKLIDLGFQIELNEKRLSAVRTRPLKKSKEKVPQEAFVPLSKDDQDEVDRALLSSNRRKVLVTHENSNIEITGELLQCLRPRAWLNDEVINVYLELLKERENREPKKFLKCHFFNTFFYKKLIGGKNGYEYKSVRRWTTQRKLGYGLNECDKIFVPIHKEIHWCLAVINKKEKKFQYLDSLKGRDSQVLNVLARYFGEEVKEKSGIDIDVHSWEQEYVEDLPEQENGYDCGVFMIKYADFYSRGLDLYFSQEHMPYFRRRTAKEILRLRAD